MTPEEKAEIKRRLDLIKNLLHGLVDWDSPAKVDPGQSVGFYGTPKMQPLTIIGLEPQTQHPELDWLVSEMRGKDAPVILGIDVRDMTREELIACLALAVSKIPGVDKPTGGTPP